MRAKSILSLMLLLLVNSTRAETGLAEEETKEFDPSKVTVERLFTEGEFEVESSPRLRWLEDGVHYTTLEDSEAVEDGKDIVRHHAPSGRSSVLVPVSRLIPAGQAEPLSIQDYQWSADADKLLIFTNTRRVWRSNSRGDYWVLHLKSGRLQKLGGEAPEATLMFAKFDPAAARVAYVHENNLYVESLASGEITALTEDGSETLINGTTDWVYEEEFGLRDGFRWSPDGTKIAYWQFETSAEQIFKMINNTDELYPTITTFPYPKAGTTNASTRVGVVSSGGGSTTWLEDHDDISQHYLARMEWAGNSEEVLVQHFNRLQNTLTVLLGDVASGDYRTLMIERDEAWVDAVDAWDFVNDDERFLWVSERDGWRHAYTFSRQTEELTLLTPGEYDMTSIESVDEAGGWLYYVAAPGSPLERKLMRAALDGSGVVEQLTPEDSGGVHSYTIAPGARWARHSVSSFGVPPRTQLVALPTHRVERVLVENAEVSSEVDALDRGESRFFRVSLEDGTELDGFEMRPPDFDPQKRYPVLFYVYGEPWGQTVRDSWGGRSYLWHTMLTQQGYVVISIDNRATASPRGREWRKMIYKKVGVVNAADQAAAAQQILEWPYLDADRVAVWGWSGGGSMTLNLMFQYPELYKVGMAVAAVPDQRYYDTIYQERYQGNPAEDPEPYVEGSPITYADQLEGDLLIVHGTGDDNVHYQGAEALINKLVELGKPFEMMAYPNRSHGISEGEGTSEHLYGLLTRFLNEHAPVSSGD